MIYSLFFVSPRFRWITTLIEHVFTLLLLVSLVIRYIWTRTVVPFLSHFYIPFLRKPTPISFRNETVLITGGEWTSTNESIE